MEKNYSTIKTYKLKRVGSFSLVSDIYYSPFNSKKILFGLNKSTSKNVKLGLRGLGYGLSMYSAIDLEVDRRNNSLSIQEALYGQSLNAIGTALPLAGLGIAGGDYLGRKYEPLLYISLKDEQSTLVKTVSSMLEVMGISSSIETRNNWDKNGGPWLYELLFKN